MTLAADTPLQSAPQNMKLVNPSFLLIGLDNGSFAGWNPSTNGVDYLPAHQGANSSITTLNIFEQFAFSGD